LVVAADVGPDGGLDLLLNVLQILRENIRQGGKHSVQNFLDKLIRVFRGKRWLFLTELVSLITLAIADSCSLKSL
jgi:hypothetical protein